MSLNLPLSPEIESLLRQQAATRGISPEELAREAVEEKLRLPGTFAELLAPVHEESERRGLGEQGAADLVEQARQEAWRLRQAKRPA